MAADDLKTKKKSERARAVKDLHVCFFKSCHYISVVFNQTIPHFTQSKYIQYIRTSWLLYFISLLFGTFVWCVVHLFKCKMYAVGQRMLGDIESLPWEFVKTCDKKKTMCIPSVHVLGITTQGNTKVQYFCVVLRLASRLNSSFCTAVNFLF